MIVAGFLAMGLAATAFLAGRLYEARDRERLPPRMQQPLTARDIDRMLRSEPGR